MNNTNTNIKADILKSEYGIKSLDDLKTVLEYIVSDKFKEDYKDNYDIDCSQCEGAVLGYVEFFEHEPRLEVFNANNESYQLANIMWLLHPENWKCEVAPVLGDEISKEDWLKLESEFIEKWNKWIEVGDDETKKSWKIEKKNNNEGYGFKISNMEYGIFGLDIGNVLECLNWEG